MATMGQDPTSGSTAPSNLKVLNSCRVPGRRTWRISLASRYISCGRKPNDSEGETSRLAVQRSAQSLPGLVLALADGLP